MTTLNFTADDLYANQRGRLSERQRGQLQQQFRLLTYLLYFGASGAVVMAAVGIFVGRVVGVWFVLLMVALAAAELVFLYPYINRSRRQFQTDLSRGMVERIDGEVSPRPYRLRRGTLDAVWIGERRFYTDRASWRTLAAGGRYRAYYAPESGTLLSFERPDESD